MRQVLLLCLAVLLTGCEQQASLDTRLLNQKQVKKSETCEASVYWSGSKIATGARYNPHSSLIAHRTAPLRSWVRITNLRNNRSTTTQVLDRGPYAMKYKRCVDLSLGVAHELGFGRGIGMVRVDHLVN